MAVSQLNNNQSWQSSSSSSSIPYKDINRVFHIGPQVMFNNKKNNKHKIKVLSTWLGSVKNKIIYNKIDETTHKPVFMHEIRITSRFTNIVKKICIAHIDYNYYFVGSYKNDAYYSLHENRYDISIKDILDEASHNFCKAIFR